MQQRTQQVGACLLDLGRHGIVRDNIFYRVEPRDFSVLRALVENAPNLVSTRALLRAGWTGKVVGDNVLHQSIGRLRKLLGDDPRRSTYIQTLAKRGYRFIAAVAEQNATLEQSVDLNPIVVYPFKDYSPCPNEAYLVDGLNFEICHQLTQMGAQVVSMDCASRAQRQGLSDLVLAARLGARTVLAGMLMVVGERLRVSAVLSDVESGRQLWSAKHDFVKTEMLDLHTWLADALVKDILNHLNGRRGPLAANSRQVQWQPVQASLGL
jgi:DNA-binding winged helix-turn-helix (wHTH) protein